MTAGNKLSTILTGQLTVTAGSLSNINYSVLASGAAINIASNVTVPGAITLDNTYGCSSSGCAPATGYINASLVGWTNLPTTGGYGVLVNGNLSGTAITINGVNAGGTTGGGGSVALAGGLTATSGNINITGLTTTGIAVGNLYGNAWGITPIIANSGAVNITGTSTTTGNGVEFGPNNSISAKSITIIGSEVGGSYAVYLNTLTIVAGGTNLNVTGTVVTNTDTGIYQLGNITDNAAGSNISFITNGKINQGGAISLVANTASTAVSVTYNTTSGTKDSSVIAGTLTIAAGTNTSPINYIIKTAGAAINPAAIGTSTLVLPGYVLFDDTYGCSGVGCTPATSFINTTTGNLGTLATASAGVTINSAIYASGNITVNAVSTNNAIDYSVAITSTGGNVVLSGGTTTVRGVYNSVASTITANNITIFGTSSGAPAWISQIGALTINSASIGGSISVTGNYIGTPRALGGIYQIGTIIGASGTNISFVSNNNIQQNGAITLVANTSGTAANIIYDVTTGNKTSSILAGSLAIPTGSSSAINYIIKTAGAAINPGAIGTSTLALPGYILLDNTYGCTGSGCTPFSGFINTTTANLAALATTSVGITVNSGVYATGNITMNAVSTSNAIDYSVAIATSNGNVTLNGGTTTLRGVYNSVASIISGNNITIIGTSSGNPSWDVQIGALTINSLSIGGNITVTGNYIGTPGALGGIYQIGSITGASGSNISFISNNNIQQNGAIILVANTSGSAANITYDVTTGNKTSSVLAGALSIPTGSTSSINYIIKTAGAAINPGAIGTSTLALPGYILLDNTYGCTGSGCTPFSGFINTTTANLAALATTSVGITVNSGVYATGNITMNAVSTSNAIDYSVAIATSNGNVTLNGGTTTLRGVYNSVASIISGNNITIIGTSSGNPSWDVQIGALTINSLSIGGNITVTGNYIGTPGALGGIYQIGSITGASGSNISFISNNNIQQNGAIILVANTSGSAANITYDVTTGNKTSSVLAGALSIPTGSTSSINYIIKTAGAAINPAAIGTSTLVLPGYVLIDNTYGCSGSGCTPVSGFINTTTPNLASLATASVGVTINNAIYASGNITVNGVTGGTSNTGIDYSVILTSTAGNVILNGGATDGRAVYNSVASIITANNITITGTTTLAPAYVLQIGGFTINNTAVGGSITATANVIGIPGAAGGIYQIGTITGRSGTNISFISNNDIDQNGTITLVANTGAAPANITYSTIAGNNTSIIGTAALSVTGTSTSAINYLVKTNGAIISVPAITVPGYILLDDSCLGCGTAITTSTAAANGAAITITGALSAGSLAGSTGVTINAVANGTGVGFTQGANAISSAAGGVTITANSQTGIAYSSTGNITATGQAITITATTTTAASISDTGTINGGVVTLTGTQSTSTATATPITATGAITANSLTVTGTGGASTTIVSLGAITINAGGGNITVTANNVAAGTNTGITQTGAINDNAVGSNISFTSNNDIDQNGTITLVANTGAAPANITYSTIAGNNTSIIGTAALSVTGTSTSAINYLVKTNGAIISVPAITVPGYILLDDSCLGCGTAITTSTAAANGAAITITGALSAGSLAGSTGVTINAVANGTGVGFTQGANAISSAAGGVTITANSQTGIAYSSTGNITATGQAITITATTTTAASISDTGTINGGVVTLTGTQSTSTATATPITATGAITANSLTVTGTGGASTTIVSLGAITINAGGGNITVTANNVAAGTNTGITQTGAINDNAVGSNISFTSNNKIAQSGAIALVANNGTPAANLIYDTTRGTLGSTIAGGVLTFTTGTGSVINYVAKSAGAAITPAAIGTSTAALPGYVTIDNTYGCTTAPCTPVSGFITTANASTLATALDGVKIASAIYAAGDITLKGVSTTASGVTYSAALNTSSGAITITGTSVGTAASSYGIYASAAAGVVSASSVTAGVVTMSGSSAGSTSLAISAAASATITGASGVYLTGRGVGGGITTAALIKNSGTLGGLTVDAAGSVSLAGANNAGVTGMRIIAGNGIAAGTITGGDITSLGTLTNTGGVIAISMAKPEASPYAIAGALGINTTNADATTNISYGIAGGMPVQPGNYVSGNYINYRQKITSTLAISVTINSDYTAVYGTAYNSNAANDWIQANATVSFTGSSTATFGLAAITSGSIAYIKSVLVFSPTVGGTTALNGTNANAVQTNTALTSTSISASDGSTVTVIPAAHKYTITPAVLGIAVSGVYNGTTTFTSANSTIAATGLAAWDTITSVTASSANANGVSTYVSSIGGTSTVGSFSASNYLINTSYNGTLSSGLPVNTSQSAATNKVSITPAPLGITISGEYSGTTTIIPTAFTVTGLVNSQTISAISSATVNNINVAANNSNYVTGITVGGGTASMNNYSITAAYNTLSGNTQNTVTLTPKALSVTGITIAAKTYDGTTSATVSGGSLVGVATVDLANVTLTQTASFVSANAANSVALIMVDSIAGSAAGNYTLTQPTGVTANIARKVITVGGTPLAANKVYDGTTATTISGGTLVGVITADLANVSLTQSGSFTQSGVGSAIGVVVSTAISGTAASNYLVTQPANLSANITAKVLTVTGTTITDKVYNGSNVATVTGGTLSGVIAGDLASVSLTQAGTFSSANAGSAIAVTISDSIAGTASANYSLVQPTGIVGKITPAPLGISVAAIYSGSTTITPTTFSVTGLVNGETLTGISSAVIDSMNVSANATNFVRSIVISGGTANAGNYSFGAVASTTPGNRLNSVTLTPKTLTVTGTLADKKVYDGTTSVTVWGGSLVGVIGVDVVTLKQVGTLNSANVGSAVPVVMADTISGFSAANYSLVQPTGITAAVTPKTITVSDGTVANKVYDGTTNAVLTGGTLVGVLAADASNVILTQAGRFSSPNVSNGIIIIASASISGSAASNYNLIQPTGITANITPAMLGISVVGVANGTNTISPISYTINGLINGQTITGLSSVSIKSSSISSNGSNFVTGIVISGGTALATNYAFSPSYNATAGISQNIVTLVAQNQKILTVTGTVASTKTYDGTTSIVITGGVLVGVTAGDTVTLVQSATLINPNVSTSAAVVMNDSITGASAANYILVQPTGILAIVNAAPLGITVTGEYNGTTTITPASFATTGLVNSETITGLSSATFSASNVANNGGNYVTSIVSSGGTAVLSNYKITQAYSAATGNTKNVATLTQKALTVGGVSVAADKIYDGSTAATITGGSLVGVIGSDAVVLNQAGTFGQSGVGTSIAVTAADTITGSAAGNYSLIQPTGITANITQKSLTVSGATVSNKVYDGTTTATVIGGSLVGLVGTDGANVTLAQSATFASANVGNGILVTFLDSISGSAAANYSLVQPSGVSMNITPKTLTVTGTVVSNKVYDTTTNATVTAGTLSGVIAADAANVTLVSAASFSSSSVGNAIALVMSDSITGSAAGNYVLTQPTGVTANITAKALTITASNVTGVYGSATGLGTSGFTQSGLLSGDSISAVTLLYSGSTSVPGTVNAGSYSGVVAVSAATGSGLSNYAITYVAGNLTVGQATLTLNPNAQSAVYNGNTLNATTFSANASNYTATGYKNSDSAVNVPLSFTGSLGFTSGGSAASVLNAATYAYTAGTLAVSTINTNYVVVLAGTLSNQYVVTPATVAISASKVYDGTTDFTAGAAGTSFTITTGIGSQTLGVTGTASASNANVVGVNSLNTTGLSLVNGTGSASNYVLPASTSNVLITPKTVAVSISSLSKVYDTTTAATLTAGTALSDGSYVLTGFVGSEGAYITQTVGSYNNANVASATTVTAAIGSAFVAKAGTTLSNYALPSSAGTATGGATITPASLTMTANDASTYVGVAPTSLTYQLAGLLGADTASSAISGASVNYTASLLNTAMNAPTLNALTPTATSSNYSLTFVKGSLMVVGNLQMIVNAGSNTASYGVVNSANESYLGNALTTGSNVSAGYCTNCGVGVVSPNIVSLTITAPTTGSNVWTATDALGTGSGAGTGQGKYTFTITPTIASGSYSAGGSVNIGNYVLSAGNLSTVSGYTTNYDVSKLVIYNVGNLNITPKVLTVSGSAVANKTYDGTNVATITGGQLQGVVATDASNIGLVQSASFASINIGSAISVTAVDSLSGTVAANYVLTQPTGLSANIAAAPVTISGLTASNKVYDTTTAATLSGTKTVVGLLSTDTSTVSGNATGTFATANAGLAIDVNVNVSSLALSNANYYVSGVTTPLTANITPAPVTIGGLTAANKVYDTTTAATLSGTKTVVGLLSTDTSTVSGNAAATFATANAGSAIAVAVNVSGLALSNANYYVAGVASPLTANITPAPITISGLAASNKVYDTTTAATLTGTSAIAGGLLGSDTATLSGTATAGTFASANAGNAIAVTANLSSLALSNANYYVSGVTTPLTANITPAPVTIGGLTAANKVYDTTTAATLSGTLAISGGLLGSDTATLSGTATAGTFASANAASGITVTANLSGLSISNPNYYIADVATALTANITGKPVTITANAQSTTYGTAIASLGTTGFVSSGFIGGDSVSAVTLTYGGSAGVAATENAGTYNGGVAPSNAVAVAGTLLSNYAITYVGGNLVINPAAITVTADTKTMTYAASSLPILSYVAVGLKNGDTPFTGALTTAATAYNGGVGSASNIGTYAITQGTLSAGSNYTISYTPALITVTPAALIVSANAQSSTYGSAFTLGSSAFTSTGLVNGDTISGVGLTVAGNAVVPGTTNIGAYTIVSNNAVGAHVANYTITYQTGVLTVNPKPINVVANSTTMVYADAALPTLTYQTVTGLVNGDTMSGALITAASAYNGSAGSASNVGTYAITQGSLTAGNNYVISYTPANLTVTAAPLTVTALDQTSIYGSLAVISQSALTTPTSGLVGSLRNGDYVSSATILYNGNQVIPGAINAGTYANAISIANAVGAGTTNYNITYVAANLRVNKATLLVTAVADGKFVSQTDLVGSATNCGGLACAGGYAGAMYAGFVNGDTSTSGALGSAALVISRTNDQVNTPGLYTNVLLPSGLNPQNYLVQYVAGNYVIAPAEQLLVKMANNATVYSTAPSYGSVTAAYLKADGTVISGIPVTVVGNMVTMNDGLGSTAQFTANAINPVNSSSGNLSVGSYALGASSPSITGSNFNSMAVIGGLDVTPKQLAYADLGIAGVSKVYDGSVYMNNLAITASSGFIAGDAISATATGTFSTKNVGTGIAYNLGVLLNGADKANYQIAVNALVNSGLYAGSNGVITQLNSVTYTGPNSGGNWSNPANWTTTGTTTVGAIPDLSNVANVIIPVATSVVYDNAVAGPVTSAVVNNGNLNFNLSSAANIAMTIAGAGSVTISNSGPITLSGINNYVGGTTLNAGSSLIVGNGSAIGAPNITSNGTAINPASFSTLSAVTLPYLNITSGTTQLLSNITTTGTQTYSDLILGSTVSGTTTLRTSNANINFLGKIDGATAKSQSLVANAGTGVVTIGDSVGSAARLNSLAMTGSSINILADIITAVGQTYNGNTFIGDASYLGRTPTVGFLYSGYNSYFQYSTPAITSTIKYLNMNPIYIRTMISEDPNVTFNGTVNDLVPNTHTLLVAAIAPDASAGSSAASSVNFGASVGNVSPLYSLNAQVVVNQYQANSVLNYVGTVSLVGNVSTYSNQTYRANLMTAQATTQPGTVTFSVYDPTATITYLLPLQTSGAGAGQMNLQNPGSLDALTINGSNNYSANQNTAGTNNWGSPAVITPALGYVPQVFVPPAFVPAGLPAYFPPASQPLIPAPANFVAPIAVPVAMPTQNSPLTNNAAVASTIQNSTNFVFFSPAQNSGSVNVVMAPDANAVAGLRMIAGMQAFNKDALIPKPESGMVNIFVKVLINGEPTTLASSSPVQGFKFTVPESLLPASIVANTATLTASPTTGSVIERAIQSDGSPLPTWLKYDPERNTFSASQVPPGAKPVEIKIQSIRNGQVMEESPPILIDTK